MKLTEVLQGVQVHGTFADQEITNVCSDSRNVEPGCLYVCIKGLHFDAHTVAQHMLDSGAAAVLVERDLGLPNQILVENTRSAWGIACANFFGNPSEKLTLIGITGTNGKTTTRLLI
ncbi:MAG: Mur ligase domain-containing protein [Clostridiales bacterium]|nr:Mur ligase domain-containing protein [Clostridiales bacterium]